MLHEIGYLVFHIYNVFLGKQIPGIHVFGPINFRY
jgi:hypothetical protein